MSRRADRRTFLAFLADFVDYGIAMSAVSMATYLPLFLRTNGASNVVIGMIPAAFAAGRMTGLLAAPRLECRPLIRRWMISAMLVERFPIFLCGVWILASAGYRPDVVVAGVMALWITYSLCNGWANTAWGAFAARSLIPPERGKLSGLGNAFGALSGLAVVPVVREAIGRYGLHLGYGTAVALAGLLLTGSALVFLRAREEPYPHVKPRVGLADYFRQILPVLRGDRRFCWFLTTMALWLAGTTGISYFTVYAMDRFQAGPTAVMGYTIAMSLGSGLAGLVGGQAAGRGGFGRVFLVGIGLIIGSMLAAFVAVHSWWIYLAFALAGAGATASWMGVVNLPLELAAHQHVPTYAAVATLVRGPIGALSPLAAGIYLERFAYPPLFLICAGVSLLAGLFLVRFVGEPRRDARAAPPFPTSSADERDPG